MDGTNGALLPGSDFAGGDYSLSQFDVQSVMQFLWTLSVFQIIQIVLLVLLVGLVFGLILTKRWQV